MLKRVALVLFAGVCVLGVMSGCAEKKKTGIDAIADKAKSAIDAGAEKAKEAEKKASEELNK